MNALRTTMALTPILPASVLSQHIAILGKTRSGKSSAARLMVEGLLDQGKPVCIIDPKGDWWGLKSSANGKKAGYPVIIFGGEHADIPINAHSGAHVAELIATGNRPCIIDLGGWMVGERTRFFIEFASMLFKLTRGLRYLVIDECHNFCPQGKVLDPDAGKMLHWANRLASEGAGKGITLISASQRPQKVHKDYLTSHETLIAMRVIHPLDRGAIKDWIDGCGDPAVGREVLSTLAGMQRGEGWVWSPEAGFGPERVQFPLFRTYDSFKARDTEHAEALEGWATVDLDDVRSKLAAVVEEAKNNDPKVLKAEIAALKKQLAAKPSGEGEKIIVDQAAVDTARSAGFDEGYAKGYMAGVEIYKTATKEIRGYVKDAIQKMDDSLNLSIGQACERAYANTTTFKVPESPSKYVPPAPKAAARPAERRPSAPAGGSASRDGINGPQQRILDALAWWASVGVMAPSRIQVAVIARYSPNGGAFQNPLGSLRSMELIQYPTQGTVALTDRGEAMANQPGTPATVEEFHARLQGILNGPQWRILEPLIREYPNSLTRIDLASRAGYAPDGGAFQNPLGSLRTLGLIDYPQSGQVQALPILFLERA